MADSSQRESARWQEALDMLITWGWVKPVGRKGEVYEVTGTGYTKADELKDGMCINTSKEPLEELNSLKLKRKEVIIIIMEEIVKMMAILRRSTSRMVWLP